MTKAEVIGIDHVYVAVSDLGRSEEFYDQAMTVLGFRKRKGSIGGDPHIHYYNRHFGYSIRPAREHTPSTTPTRLDCTTSVSGSSTRPPLTAWRRGCGTLV